MSPLCVINLSLLIIVFLMKMETFKALESQNVKNSEEIDGMEAVTSQQSCTSNRNQYALAVVPFDESSLLPHQQPERNFSFVGHPINIKQNWGGLGVAAVVWDAAIVLGEYMERNTHLVNGKSVIELGSGTGLAGLVASFLGGDVTVTERQEALSFLESTIIKNLPKDKNYKINIKELDWTKPLDEFSNNYDVILGADIIYIKETFNDLYRTLLHLSSKDTLVLISCKIRYDRDSDFLKILEKDFILTQTLYDKQRDIRIYSVYRKF